MTGIQAVFIQVNRVKNRLIEREGLDCTEISRAFDCDMITGIYEHLASQVKTLLRSVRDQDFIGRD